MTSKNFQHYSYFIISGKVSKLILELALHSIKNFVITGLKKSSFYLWYYGKNWKLTVKIFRLEGNLDAEGGVGVAERWQGQVGVGALAEVGHQSSHEQHRGHHLVAQGADRRAQVGAGVGRVHFRNHQSVLHTKMSILRIESSIYY